MAYHESRLEKRLLLLEDKVEKLEAKCKIQKGFLKLYKVTTRQQINGLREEEIGTLLNRVAALEHLVTHTRTLCLTENGNGNDGGTQDTIIESYLTENENRHDGGTQDTVIESPNSQMDVSGSGSVGRRQRSTVRGKGYSQAKVNPAPVLEVTSVGREQRSTIRGKGYSQGKVNHAPGLEPKARGRPKKIVDSNHTAVSEVKTEHQTRRKSTSIDPIMGLETSRSGNTKSMRNERKEKEPTPVPYETSNGQLSKKAGTGSDDDTADGNVMETNSPSLVLPVTAPGPKKRGRPKSIHGEEKRVDPESTSELRAFTVPVLLDPKSTKINQKKSTEKEANADMELEGQPIVPVVTNKKSNESKSNGVGNGRPLGKVGSYAGAESDSDSDSETDDEAPNSQLKINQDIALGLKKTPMPTKIRGEDKRSEPEMTPEPPIPPTTVLDTFMKLNNSKSKSKGKVASLEKEPANKAAVEDGPAATASNSIANGIGNGQLRKNNVTESDSDSDDSDLEHPAGYQPRESLVKKPRWMDEERLDLSKRKVTSLPPSPKRVIAGNNRPVVARKSRPGF